MRLPEGSLILFGIANYLLIVSRMNLEIALRMLADRAHLRSLLSDNDMTAV